MPFFAERPSSAAALRRGPLHRVVWCAILGATPLFKRTAMGSSTVERLRKEALSLPDAERAELAKDLVSSLDGPVDSEAADAWDAELLRRIDEVAAGKADFIERDTFSQQMRERLARI
jgi:putative addiction module component (TIGR02574 family)